MQGAEIAADVVVSALRDVRFTASCEERLQTGIGEVLEAKFPGQFIREYILNRRDRPDFFAEATGIVVEVISPTADMITWQHMPLSAY
jgi:hypothetical protein